MLPARFLPNEHRLGRRFGRKPVARRNSYTLRVWLQRLEVWLAIVVDDDDLTRLEGSRRGSL
jgi:hypothetical protein